MSMWRPGEPVEENASSLAGIDPHSERRRSRRRALTGLLTKPWLRLSKMFDPTERSSALRLRTVAARGAAEIRDHCFRHHWPACGYGPILRCANLRHELER
jgi:hypothetical protein